MEEADIAAVAALDDDVRRALFRCVRDAAEPVTRERAAQSVGISRKLAAFHLDKLVAAGLLRSRTAEPATAPSGGSGTRRVGRAPKVYEPSGRDVRVCVPQREPALLAEILLAAVRDRRADETGEQAVQRVARERGERHGAAIRAEARPGRLGAERAVGLTERAIACYGFEPARAGGGLRLRNCPFHPLVQHEPELVCGLNHAFLHGVLAGLGADAALSATLAPAAGECCVRFDPQRPAAVSAPASSASPEA